MFEKDSSAWLTMPDSVHAVIANRVDLLDHPERAALRHVRSPFGLSVLAVGWLLGGTVGVGTVLYAVSIGPLAQYFIPRLTAPPGRPTAAGASTGDDRR